MEGRRAHRTRSAGYDKLRLGGGRQFEHHHGRLDVNYQHYSPEDLYIGAPVETFIQAHKRERRVRDKSHHGTARKVRRLLRNLHGREGE